MEEDLGVSKDMPTQESSVSAKDNNNDDPNGTGTLNCPPDAFNETVPEESDDDLRVQDSARRVNINENIHSRSHTGSETEPNILGRDQVSLPKVKVSSRIIEKSEAYSSPKSVSADSSTGLQSHVESRNKLKNVDSSRVVVDTAAPIESVKDAVSKFGGIVDWKTHKVQTLERCRYIDQELDKTLEEMTECRNRAQAADDSKMELSTELDRTTKQIHELELQLSSLSSHTQPSKPVKQVNDDEFDAAAKQELKAIVAEHEAALAELKSLKEELDAENSIIELAAELVAAKQSLAAAQADYREAEDQRNQFIVASEQDTLSWERGMKQIEAEVDKLNQEYLSAKDLKSRLDSSSALLCSLKSKKRQDNNEAENSKTELLLMKKELEKVKLGIDKAAADVSFLKGAVTLLQSELENEQNGLTLIKEGKGIAMASVQSLEAELSTVMSEMAYAEMKKKEAREKLEDLTSKLQQAAEEADQVKFLKQAVQEELRQATDEAEQANAELTTSETRLHAAKKELEATMASEELAFAADNSLQETETGDIESAKVVTISSNEYLSLSRHAQETEDQAKTRLAAAFIHLEEAKKSESTSLQKLEEVTQELSVKKGAYATATKKCGRALSDKLRLEQELRSWRTKNEQSRKARESAFITTDSVLHPVSSPRSIKQRKDARKSGKVVATEPLHNKHSPKSAAAVNLCSIDPSPDLKMVKKKKRSIFPRLLMFFGKRKAYASKKVL